MTVTVSMKAEGEEGGSARVNHQCPWCGARFRHASNYWRHVRALHRPAPPAPAPPRLACPRPSCNKTFSRKGHLEEHVQSHGATRALMCEVCGARSKNSAALRMHRRTHAASRHTCVQCGAGFKRAGQLRDHVSVHTGEKAHRCDCGKAFRLRSQLNLHRKRCANMQLQTDVIQEF